MILASCAAQLQIWRWQHVHVRSYARPCEHDMPESLSQPGLEALAMNLFSSVDVLVKRKNANRRKGLKLILATAPQFHFGVIQGR